MIFATLAGILTLILNGLLIWSINRKTRFSQLSPMDHFKSSLAVCGVLYGKLNTSLLQKFKFLLLVISYDFYALVQ